MIVELTYHCTMGCIHCMSDCKGDHSHMSVITLRDVLAFTEKNGIRAVSFSGGEIFEHPQIVECLEIIAEYETRVRNTPASLVPIAFITNGRKLSTDKFLQEAYLGIRSKIGKEKCLLQVTDDPRFYPESLSEKQKYQLKRLDAIIDRVPSDPVEPTKCLYPQGRALKNFGAPYWRTIAPKCINARLAPMQIAGCTFAKLNEALAYAGKLCTPTIAPDGGIKLGESALCPSVASIYDTDKDIMDKIRNFKCLQCEISIDRFRKSNPVLASLLF